MGEWKIIESCPEGVIVDTKISDESGERNECKLIKKGSLFFLPDMSMYVYYCPTHWKSPQTNSKERI